MYKRIRYWKTNYARGDYPDKRAAEDFIELETKEISNSLKAELNSIAKGNYDEDILISLLGNKILAKHTSFEDWAKKMLLWMATASRR